MGDLKTVGIKELKNNLSAYLREVRRGTRVLVSDRNRVVAELHEPRPGYAPDDRGVESIHPRLAEWIDARIVLPRTRPGTKLPASPVRLDDGIASRLLHEDRGDPDR